MYHHVSDAVQPGPYARALTVPPTEFVQQLRWLRARGCAAKTVEAVLADVRTGRVKRCDVALTFDDGYDDAVSFAAPILEAYGDRATFYIPSGFVGMSGHLKPAGVRHLAQAGMEIASHSVSHPDLAALPAARAANELTLSRSALERISRAAVISLAYPAGQYNLTIEKQAQAAGYGNAVTSDAGALTLETARSRPYALPRFRILRGKGLALMARVLGRGPAAAAAVQPWRLRALHAVARKRVEGNDPESAERIAVALLAGDFPVQILKVHVDRIGPATVAGIMLSGVKFHRPVSRREFAAVVGAMIDRTFEAAASADEVDVWAVVPQPVAPNAPVSGDVAVPAERTVFSAAVPRQRWNPAAWPPQLGATYWDRWWVSTLAAP